MTQDGGLGSETPHIQGVRENSQGLIRTLNAWDRLLLLDGHLMSRVNHGYANTYGTITVLAAAPGPRASSRRPATVSSAGA